MFDLIQAIPAGPQGPPFAQAVVDAVNTLTPGEPATVQSSFDGTNVHLTFGIPRGVDGNNGADGSNGADGAQGPPFTNFVVDGVNALAPGESATVQANFDGAAVRLVFGVPRGVDGSNGGEGPQGPQGPPFANAVVDSVTTLNPGEAASVNTLFDGSNVRFTFGLPRGADGNPGEVSQAQLDAALASTSNNSNAVSTLDIPFGNDPPTLADLETLRGKINELIAALRR